jgi:flagellar biosynthesis protein FlhG
MTSEGGSVGRASAEASAGTATAATSATAQIITIAGGKGGVGKSIIASNLAVAIAQLGRHVVLVDLDLGAANQHLLLGVARPRAGVPALIEGSIEDANDAISPTPIPNLSLVAGSGAVLGAANISHTDKQRLIRKLRSIDAVVILDVGAGVAYNALDFFLIGPQKIIVTTPQVTSVHDAYSFLKGAVLRMLRQEANRAIEKALLEPALFSAEATNVRAMLQNLRGQKPEFAERVFDRLRRFGAHIIGNQVSDQRHVGIFRSIAKMFHDYLGIEVPISGWLKHSQRINESVNERKPLMLGAPCEETRTFRQMAEALLAEGAIPEEDEIIDLMFDDLDPVETTGAHQTSGHQAAR